MRHALDSQVCWDLIAAPDELVEEATNYIQKWRQSASRQVGVHIRRGDLAYFNWRKKSLEEKDSMAKHENVEKWMAADQRFQDLLTPG